MLPDDPAPRGEQQKLGPRIPQRTVNRSCVPHDCPRNGPWTEAASPTTVPATDREQKLRPQRPVPNDRHAVATYWRNALAASASTA